MSLKQRKQEIFPIEKSWKTDTDHEIEQKKKLSKLTIWGLSHVEQIDKMRI